MSLLKHDINMIVHVHVQLHVHCIEAKTTQVLLYIASYPGRFWEMKWPGTTVGACVLFL